MDKYRKKTPRKVKRWDYAGLTDDLLYLAFKLEDSLWQRPYLGIL